MTFGDFSVPRAFQHRRRDVLRSAGMLAAVGSGSLRPRTAQAQILGSPGPHLLWLEGIRHVSIAAQVLVQDTGDRGWRGLRRAVTGGDYPQASATGLIRNDIAGDGVSPAPIDIRVTGTSERLLTGPRSTWRTGPIGPPELYRGDRRMSQAERDARVSIFVQFYIRDISQDLVFPPPSSVASVMLTEIIRYDRPGKNPPSWVLGPVVTVETVVRSGATDWMFARLDATVGRALEPWIMPG